MSAPMEELREALQALAYTPDAAGSREVAALSSALDELARLRGEVVDCSKCHVTGFSGRGTGYDDVCGECGGAGILPSPVPALRAELADSDGQVATLHADAASLRAELAEVKREKSEAVSEARSLRVRLEAAQRESQERLGSVSKAVDKMLAAQAGREEARKALEARAASLDARAREQWDACNHRGGCPEASGNADRYEFAAKEFRAALSEKPE